MSTTTPSHSLILLIPCFIPVRHGQPFPPLDVVSLPVIDPHFSVNLTAMDALWSQSSPSLSSLVYGVFQVGFAPPCCRACIFETMDHLYYLSIYVPRLTRTTG